MKFSLSLLTAIILLAGCAGSPSIPNNEADVNPLKLGDYVPNISLQGPFGHEENLAELASKKSLFVFYRGGWCPFCTSELNELIGIEDELYRLGIHIVAISPDQPEYLRQSLEDQRIGYKLLSDSRMQAARMFGVAFRVDDREVENMRRNGMDIQARSGHDHNLLPAPSVFLTNDVGEVVFSFTKADHRDKIDQEMLMAAAHELVNKGM
ncbi:MAG: peroxiredoxin-like family protein [Balneolaceae bacterium]